MTPDPKTPAQRLARVFRILAVLAEREVVNYDTYFVAEQCGAFQRETIERRYRVARHTLDYATRRLVGTCRAAGIDPESIT